jgi:hypothetical protein
MVRRPASDPPAPTLAEALPVAWCAGVGGPVHAQVHGAGGQPEGPAVTALCPCGLELHYSSLAARRYVERQVADLGETVIITTPAGSWAVPRHFIALHSLKAADLPALAAQYEWEQV